MLIKNPTNITQVFTTANYNNITISPNEIKDINVGFNQLPAAFFGKDMYANNLLVDYNAHANTKPKIMFLLNSNYVGGAEYLFINLIEKIKEKYECILVFLTEANGVGFFKHYPCQTYNLNHILFQNKGVAVGFLTQLLNIDLLCLTNTLTELRMGVKAHTLCKIIDVIHAIEGINFIYPSNHNYVKSEDFDVVVCVNSIVTDTFKTRFSHHSLIKAQTIVNGIDTDIFSYEKRSKYTNKIGNMARIAPEKNVQRFANIAKANPDKEFIWIGGINPVCANYSTTLHIPKNMTITGYIDKHETVKFLKELDMFMLTSDNEGMPLAVIEAMATGLPVISTKVGNMHELIDKDCLFETEEQASNLIKRIYADPKWKEKLSKENRKVVEEKYSLNTMVEKYDKLFQELI